MARNWYLDRFTPYEGGIKIECEVCKTPYWLPKSKANLYVTCGSECSKRKREADTEYRKRTCKTCGIEIKPRATQISNGKGIYCSHKCQGVAQTGEANPFYGKAMTDHQKAKWKASRDANGSWLIAAKNPRWRGGYEAKKQRDKRNGWPVQAARRAKTKIQLPDGCITEIGNSQKWKCVACRKSIKLKYHVDHIMPLALGGKHERLNIQLLCPSCNLSKHKKHPVDFMQSIGYLL